MESHDIPNKQKAFDYLYQALTMTSGAIMTLADYLREEGRKEGIHKGRALGEYQILLQQLQWRFGKIPSSYKKIMRNANETQLFNWAKKLLKAKNLAEIFESGEN